MNLFSHPRLLPWERRSGALLEVRMSPYMHQGDGFFRVTRMVAALIVIAMLTSGCYFFRKRSTGESEESGGSSSRAGGSIGSRAGGVQSTELAELHATATSLAPAAIRPDPDTVVRRLLLQYREEGATVARQIGEVEQFRRLLGGATEDFSVTAQVTYDATSLLAKLKVAETVCEGLVAPNGTAHPGWTSILPAAPDQSTTNLTFLAQRIRHSVGGYSCRSDQQPDGYSERLVDER